MTDQFPSLQIHIKIYPAVYQYLKSFGKRIEQTGTLFTDETGQMLKTRKLTSHKWFETQYPIAFYKEFSKEKFIWKRNGSQLRFSYSDQEIYCLDSTCILTGEKIKFLTALLNSKVCQYQMFEQAPRTGVSDLIISVQALEPILVHYPNQQAESEIAGLFDQIIALRQQGKDATEPENQIDKLV